VTAADRPTAPYAAPAAAYHRADAARLTIPRFPGQERHALLSEPPEPHGRPRGDQSGVFTLSSVTSGADVEAGDEDDALPRLAPKRKPAEWPALIRYETDGSAREIGRCCPEDREKWQRFYRSVNAAVRRVVYGVRS